MQMPPINRTLFYHHNRELMAKSVKTSCEEDRDRFEAAVAMSFLSCGTKFTDRPDTNDVSATCTPCRPGHADLVVEHGLTNKPGDTVRGHSARCSDLNNHDFLVTRFTPSPHAISQKVDSVQGSGGAVNGTCTDADCDIIDIEPVINGEQRMDYFSKGLNKSNRLIGTIGTVPNERLVTPTNSEGDGRPYLNECARKRFHRNVILPDTSRNADVTSCKRRASKRTRIPSPSPEKEESSTSVNECSPRGKSQASTNLRVPSTLSDVKSLIVDDVTTELINNVEESKQGEARKEERRPVGTVPHLNLKDDSGGKAVPLKKRKLPLLSQQADETVSKQKVDNNTKNNSRIKHVERLQTSQKTRTDKGGAPTLQFAIDPCRSHSILQDVARAFREDEDGDLPLHIAVVQENAEMANKLIELMKLANRGLNVYNNLRQSPLHLAVLTNQPEIVESLLLAGMKQELQDRRGQTAAHLAVEGGHIRCLEVLLRHTTPEKISTSINYEGMTPLHSAIIRGQNEMARMLVSYGVDVNVQDGKSGRTALFFAAEEDNLELLTDLLRHGASLDVCNYAGSTAQQAAMGRGNASVVSELSKLNAYRPESDISTYIPILENSYNRRHEINTNYTNDTDTVSHTRPIMDSSIDSTSAIISPGQPNADNSSSVTMSDVTTTIGVVTVNVPDQNVKMVDISLLAMDC